MTELLKIERIDVERFGGWQARTLQIPDQPLIVIHGANEAGKSTLAELVTWLLVGPSGSAANAQRFGAPGETIGGTLSGTLGDIELVATGRFKVLRAGAPNDNGLEVRAERSLDAAQWRERLGGVDPQVFSAIYRLWGEQLHQGESIEGQLSRVALGALSGRRDVHGLIVDLRREVTAITTARGRNAESVTTIATRIAEIEREIGAASANAEMHLDLARQCSELEQQRIEIASTLSQLRLRSEVIGQVLALLTELDGLDRAQRERAGLEQISDEWMALIEDPGLVSAAVTEMHAATEQSNRLAAQAAAVLEPAGLDQESVEALALGTAEMLSISAEVSALRTAQEAVAAIASQREAERSELDRCHQRLAAAVARMPDAEIGDIAQMRLGGTERAAIAAAIATWEAAYRSAAVSEVQSLEANDRAAVTEREVARLSTAWEAFGTGNDAEAWFASPGSGGGERSGGLWWLSPVLVMVIAAVAVAVGQPIVGAGSAVVALIVGWLAVSGRRRAPLSGDQHAAMMEVAARLIAIKRQHADEVTAAERIADVCRRDLDHRERSRDDLVRHCSEFGLPIVATTPGIAASQIAAVDSIIDAHQQLSTVRSRLAGLETGHAAALEQVRLAGERVRTSADAAGVPTVAALETLDALLPDYGRAQAAWGALVAARRSERTAIDRFEQLIADLPEQVRGWRPERIAERAGELHTVNELRRDLDQDIAQITARIDARRAADEALGELLDRGHSEAELRTMVTEISEQITALSAASARISEEIGTLGGRLTELRRVDRLGALAVERGTLDERSDELAVEALVAVVTERILRSVAEEYERQHQPALISATERMARSVAPQWTAVLVRAAGDDHSEVVVSQRDQPPIPSAQLSTGARSLLYLALRIAMAEHDAEQRSVTVPLICDDPLVHLDDDRAESAFQLLRVASGSGRQVIVFTCHERTVRTARAAGAAIVEI